MEDGRREKDPDGAVHLRPNRRRWRSKSRWGSRTPAARKFLDLSELGPGGGGSQATSAPWAFRCLGEKILWTDVSGDFGRQRKICFQVSRDFENAPASGENPLPRIVTVPCRWRSPAPESAPLRRRSPPIPTASSFHASSPLFFLFLFPQPPERFLLSSGLTGGTGGDIIKQDTGPQGCPWDREAQRL